MGMLAAHKLSKDNFNYILDKISQSPSVEKLRIILNPKASRKNLNYQKPLFTDEEANELEISQEFRKVLSEFKSIKQKDREQVSY